MNIEQLLSNDNLMKYYDIIIGGIMGYFPKIFGALFVIWIGFKIVNVLKNLILKLMDKQKIDPMLKSFLTSLFSMILKTLVFISAAGILWVETSSFVAMLAAAGLAIGLALKGTLQNFASWVMILLFKPFKLWDYVEVWGHAGSVTKIEIFNTVMLTWDKKTIIIPNSEITSSSMVNYSAQPKRRIDLEIWISYTDSIEKAKEVLEEIAKNEKRIIKKDWVVIWVKELWADSVILVFRTFVKSAEYWDVYFSLNENIKNEFDANGLNFPYPQRDVHLYKEK